MSKEEKKLTIQEWIKAWDEGKFNKPDVDTMIEAGWHDWFCKDQSLFTRLKKMVPMIRMVAESRLLGPQPQYVFFKNNCPLDGKLYDSFSVCNISDSAVQWWIAAKMGYTRQPYAQICYRGRGFKINLIEEYYRLHYCKLPIDKSSRALANRLIGGVRTIKHFFKNEDMVLKHRVISNNVPFDYCTQEAGK